MKFKEEMSKYKTPSEWWDSTEPFGFDNPDTIDGIIYFWDKQQFNLDIAIKALETIINHNETLTKGPIKPTTTFIAKKALEKIK